MLNEIRFAARSLLKSPGLALIAVVTLGLGIGTVTFMFSLVYGALYRGLPFPEGEQIMHLSRTNLSANIEQMGVTIHDFVDWREQQRSLEELAGVRNGTVNVSGTERPIRFDGAFMTANGFRVLRAQPFLGRGFRDGEEGPDSPHVVVLGYAVWRDHFESDPGVVGRTIRVNGEQSTVIGVMPEGFRFPENQEIWVPLADDVLEITRGDGYTLDAFGRLRPGVTLDQAMTEYAGIAQRLETAYAESNEGIGVRIQPFTEAFMGRDAEILLLTMLAVVFLVLFVACANVANLLLARAATQTKAVAIRTALGAGRGRIVLRLLAEAGVLAGAGAALGVGVAWMGLNLFLPYAMETNPPFWFDFSIDAPILLFVVVVVALVTILSGIFPGVQASGTRVHEILKDESRGSSSLRIGRLSRMLVVGEIAFSVGLLVAAGLMIKGMVKLKNLDYGFQTENVFTARVGLFENEFPDAASKVRFHEEVLDRLRSQPGVLAASLTDNLPGLFSPYPYVGIQGVPYATDQDYPGSRHAVITPGFFETFGVDLLSGRDFTRQDAADGLPVAIVNRSFAERFFPGEDPLGRQIRTGRSNSEAPWLTVVGMAPDLYMQGVQAQEGDPEGFYTPLAQDDIRFASIVIRAQRDAMALTPMVRDQVTAVHPDTPLYWVRSQLDAVKENNWQVNLFGSLFVVFGFVALFLATIGLYGVMSFATGQRTHEVGIRMALGAEAGDVVRLVVRTGAIQLFIGLTVGLGLAAVVSRGMRDMLFRVEPWDFTVFLVISAVLTVTGLAASIIPARRATRVDPVEALRYE